MSLFDPSEYHNPTAISSEEAHSLFGPETIRDTYGAAVEADDEETIDALFEAHPRKYLETILGEEAA